MLNSDPAAKNRKCTGFEHTKKHKEPVLSQAPAPTGSLKGQGRTKAPGDQTFLMWGDTVCFKCSDKKKKKNPLLKNVFQSPKTKHWQ